MRENYAALAKRFRRHRDRLARRYAEAKSLEMMQRFVRDASPADILKMQQELDVIREDKPPAGSGVTVIVATPGNPNNRLPSFEGFTRD